MKNVCYIMALLLSNTIFSQNLIKNASFEEGINFSNKLWGIFNEIPYWMNDESFGSSFEIQSKKIAGINASNGLHKVELDGNSNSSIFQNVKVDINKSYILSFDYSSRTNNIQSNKFNLYINNTLYQSFQPNQKKWQYYSTIIEPQSQELKILFQGSGISDSYGALIDNIKLQELNFEPANLIKNGSFENTNLSKINKWKVYNSIPYWQSNSEPFEIQRGLKIGGLSPKNGLNKLELDAHKNSSITQEIQTDQDSKYLLKLSYAGRKRNLKTNKIDIFWNDNFIATLNSNRRRWEDYQFILDSQLELSKLKFVASGVSDSLGGYLDHIQLYKLKEDTKAPLINFLNLEDLNSNLNIQITDESTISNINIVINDTEINDYNFDGENIFLNLDHLSIKQDQINILSISASDSKGNTASSAIAIDLRESFIVVKEINGVDEIGLDIGNVHNCTLTQKNEVKCWGFGGFGYLGYANTVTIGDNEDLETLPSVDLGEKVIDIQSGDTHNCALLESGNIRCFGANQFGQLGIGNTQTIGDNEHPSSVTSLKLGESILKIVAGSFHTCALRKDGKAFCWGLGANGRLGQNNTQSIGDDELIDQNYEVTSSDKIIDISAGTSHTCALFENKKVKCWGRNQFGQLGIGFSDLGDNETIDDIPFLDFKKDIIKISAGGDHTCVLFLDNKANCFGRNDFKQLGYGNLTVNNNAVLNDQIRLENIYSISAGKFTTCFITQLLKAKCIGRNDSGQLGLGNTDEQSSDDNINSLPNVQIQEDILSITPSGNHTCTLTVSFQLYCFGNGALGKLGLGSSQNIGDNEDVDSAGALKINVLQSNVLTVELEFDPKFGTFPLNVSFDASKSTSLNAPIKEYHWTFGDTQTSTSSLALIEHTYEKEGVYIVTLKVIDELGNEATLKVAINVFPN